MQSVLKKGRLLGNRLRSAQFVNGVLAYLFF